VEGSLPSLTISLFFQESCAYIRRFQQLLERFSRPFTVSSPLLEFPCRFLDFPLFFRLKLLLCADLPPGPRLEASPSCEEFPPPEAFCVLIHSGRDPDLTIHSTPSSLSDSVHTPPVSALLTSGPPMHAVIPDKMPFFSTRPTPCFLIYLFFHGDFPRLSHCPFCG